MYLKTISIITALLLALLCFSLSIGKPLNKFSTLNQNSSTSCTIPDTIKYEAEHGTLIGQHAYKKYQPNSSNDTSVASHTGVEFIMQYPADKIKIVYGTGLTGTKNLKVNGVQIGTFTINNTGGYHKLEEAELAATIKAGDTVYVGDLTYIELDCIKAYYSGPKKPYINVTAPNSYDTVTRGLATTLTVTANDTDGTITAVKFRVTNDTTYIDSVAPYSFTYTPTTIGHWGLVATAFDDCGDSTVAAQRHYYVEDELVSFSRYEAEQGTIIGEELGTVYRNGVSNDTNVQYISYVDKGVQIIANEDADGVVVGYGTYQNGLFRLKINGVNSGLYNIVHSNGYNNVHKAAIDINVNAGDTIFVTTPGPGGAYLELDYIETFSYANILPQVSITNPTDYDTVYLDSTVVFTANASDTDGTVDSVKFLVEGYAPFVDATSPYEYSFTADSIGIKKITATAYDDDGDSTISVLKRFFVRNIIPDSLKYEAEKWTLKGTAVTSKTTGASNDSTVAYLLGANNGVEFIMKYDADAIILGYGTGNTTPGTASLKINGASAGSFTTGHTGSYGTTKESVINTSVSAGDTIFVGEFTVYSHMDYIKAYNVNGYAKSEAATYISTVPENEEWNYNVGSVPSGSSIRKDTLNGKKFKIVNDTQVVTQISFDYEDKDRWYFMIDTGGTEVLYQVNVENVTGTFDANGAATAAVAAKYSHVSEGDYIYWNTTANSKEIYDVSGINVSYPNKILIQGKEYLKINIDLKNANGNSNDQQVVVTNFLGQVEVQRGIKLQNIDANRLTGKYDSANGYGHYAYKGWDAGYEFPHGTFGIYGNNKWEYEDAFHHIDLNTKTNRVELDYIEAANGGFSGINWKYNNDGTADSLITDSSTVHHCFVHDVGSEGLYIGSTQSGVQQVFTNLTVENNVFLRCGGEGIQAGWLYGNNIIRNNVVHSGVDWKKPFQLYQDGIVQVSVVGGGTKVENNIFFAGGEAAGIIEIKDNITPNTITEDTVTFANNLFYALRSGKFVHYGLYNDSFTKADTITHLVFDGNYYKMIGEDYTELDTATNFSHTIWSLKNSANTTIARNNKYDNSIDSLVRTNFVSPVLSNNTQQTIDYPKFRNYLDRPDSFNYLNISRYTDSTINGNAAIWSVGNIVQHWNSNGETRFYKCIQATSSPSNQPPKDNSNTAYWELVTWLKADSTISYFPPDDVRLVAGSFFDSLEMGINDSATASSFVIPNSQEDIRNTAPQQKENEKNILEEGLPKKLEETNNRFEFRAYPNPTSNILYLSGNIAIQSVSVYNSLGKLCLKQEVKEANSATLNLQGLSNGLYIIRAYSINNQVAIAKVQVVK
jgi:hypothetical protein